MKISTGEVMSALNSVEDKFGKIVDQISKIGDHLKSSFSNAQSEIDTTIDSVNQISSAIENTEQLELLGQEEMYNLDQAYSLMKSLNNMGAVLTDKTYDRASANAEVAEELKKQIEAMNDAGKISDAHYKNLSAAVDRVGKKQEFYLDKIQAYHDEIGDVAKDISKTNVKDLKIRKDQVKMLQSYASKLENILDDQEKLRELGWESVDAAKQFLINMEMAGDKIEENVGLMQRMQTIGSGISSTFKELSIVGDIMTKPLNAAIGELEKSHQLWKQNRQAANNFYKDGRDLGVAMYEGIAQMSSASGELNKDMESLGFTTEGTIFTMEQAQESLAAAMQSSFQAVAATGDELNKYAVMAGHSAAATGLATNELADMALQIKAVNMQSQDGRTESQLMADSFEQAADQMNILTNVSAKYRFSQKEMATLSGLVTKRMHILDDVYTDIKTTTGKSIKPMQQYTTMLAGIGKAAKDAGHSSELAMNAFAGAMEQPMENVMLLGSAIASTNPGEQMMAIGENAVKAAAMMEGKPLFVQQQIAKMYGKSVDEIYAMADAHQGLTDQYGDLSNAENLAKMNEEIADKETAAAERAKAQEDAMNTLSEAGDEFRIILADILGPLSSFIKMIGAFIGSPIGKTITFVVGGLVALKAAMGGVAFAAGTLKDGISTLGKGLKLIKLDKFGDMFSNFAGKMGAGSKMVDKGAESMNKLSKNTAKVPQQKGFADFTKEFVRGLNNFAKLKGAAVMQAAVLVAAIGISLAVGVAAIGLAMKLMPPDKVIELAVVLTGLLVAVGVLAALGPIGAPALMGAVLLLAIGVALGAAIALIGAAMHAFPDNTPEVAMSMATMLGAFALAAAMAPLAAIAAAALAVALPIMAVGFIAFGLAALMFGDTVTETLTALSEAMTNIGPDAGLGLAAMAGGLVALSAALAGAGIMSFFGPDFVDTAKELGEAMAILAVPIAKIGALGESVGQSFVLMAEGLKKFIGVLQEDAGWFDNFEDKAQDMAKAMDVLAPSLKELTGVNAAAAQDAAKDTAAIVVEEIKSRVGVDIENQNESNQEILEELKSINSKLDNVGADEELGQNVAKSKEALMAMLQEMMFSGGTGQTSSNTNYAL